MANSERDYKIVIPEHVARQFEELLPYGLAAKDHGAFEALKRDPNVGLPVPGGAHGHGPMVYTFTVRRDPIGFELIVSYEVNEEERKILFKRASLYQDPAGEE